VVAVTRAAVEAEARGREAEGLEAAVVVEGAGAAVVAAVAIPAEVAAREAVVRVVAARAVVGRVDKAEDKAVLLVVAEIGRSNGRRAQMRPPAASP